MPPAARLSIVCAAAAAVVVLAAAPVRAADPSPACAPSVALALNTWDSGVAAAEKLGSRAADMARQKGRDLLLPLLGIDPKTVTAQPGDDTAADLGREVEASRNDPARREALCVALTDAMNAARDKVGAGLDALKGALERFGPAQPQQPVPAGKEPLIKT